MCGIAGLIDSGLSREKLEEVLRGFEHDLHHRGPDDGGYFISRDGQAGLVNRRLSILDLSPAGHQPMRSLDGRYTIAFNGEIYNFRALRAKLTDSGERLMSHSDTEVVLELFRREGPKCLDRLEGMFAFAIWDEEDRSCFLVRDPLGIKPLYYQAKDGALCFASEIRALLASGLVSREVSAEGTHGYLTNGSVPEPFTLVDDVKMLLAGHYLVWRDGAAAVTKYWDAEFGEEEMSYPDAVKLVRVALDESIERHLVSDVPVGVFLSGGIDSTTLVALASKKTKEPLRTFSISFDDPAFDEGNVAARTALHVGTKHSDWRLDSVAAKRLLDEFLARSDQPSIDGFNTFCVSKMAHDHSLKVVLSGLGGDEVFGGYHSFAKVPAMLKASRWLEPVAPLRKVTGRLIESFGGPRTRRLGRFLQQSPNTAAAYECMRGIFTTREADRLLPFFGTHGLNEAASHPPAATAQPTLEDDISYLELSRYMRNQLLRDSDVMSMAWSLELRVPFADHKLIDAVGRIPARWRLARSKQMLLDAVPEIPEWVRNRPKQGFTFPFKDWATTEWRDVFDRIEDKSPVPLKNWYRTWCLFALENFLTRNQIDAPLL